MKIHSLLDTKDHKNVYCCNNSLVHWRDNLYLMAYRRIQYKTYNDRIVHPWKMWDNGHKFLHPDPDNPGSVAYGRQKFRQQYSPDVFINLRRCTSRIGNFREFDSTGLVLLRYFPETAQPWQEVFHIDNLFGKDMNQDARLHIHASGRIYITYNGFFIPDKVRMLYREIHITDDFLYLTEELDLLKTYRTVEKNCVMFNDNVIYSIHRGLLTVHTVDGVHTSHHPLLNDLTLKYNAEISLGSSPIPYRGNYIALGHIKMQNTNEALREFMQHVRPDKIYKHGKYIYFMFIYEFTADYTITRISNCLIPTDHIHCHEPYLLVFPMGIAYGRNQDEILISYGEGDVRCKILSISMEHLENILEENRFSPFRFRFYDIHEEMNKPRILHFGYFFEHNCGDDMFMLVFRFLQQKYYPMYSCFFRNEYKRQDVTSKDLIIFGGGDIITPYFLKNIDDGKQKFAVSVGCPYTAYFEFFKYFSLVTLRNPRDVQIVSAILPQQNIYSFPDLGFILPEIFVDAAVLPSDRMRIGLCLPRTYYGKRGGVDYMNFVVSTAKLVRQVLDAWDCDVYLIPFCTNTKKHYENDYVLNEQILELCNTNHVISVTLINNYDQVAFTYRLVRSMDFVICGRFHAHVFCIASQTPFVSLSCSRKCYELMHAYNIQDQMIQLRVNHEDKPIEYDPTVVMTQMIPMMDNRKTLRERLTHVYSQHIKPYCDAFLRFWKDLFKNDKNIVTS